MTPYIRQFIPDEEIAIFEKVRRAVVNMPDIDLGNDEKDKPIILSCHILARAVAKIFSLRCVDGYFYPCHDHSWLITPKNNIIDIYPVAILGGPIMMDGNNGIIARHLYQPQGTQKISRGRFGKKSFRKAVSRICAALNQTSGVA